MINCIENKYRPVPFWSWNEKLDTRETARQVELMHTAGIGGFFMHARGGLQTDYMSEEWFENIRTGITEAKRFDMAAWAYDENGWPSGFGDGLVNGLGADYQQKYLRCEKGTEGEHTIAQIGEYRLFYELNPFYVDTLDAKVIREFLEKIYTPYYERFGNDLEGFFTDEPQISRNGIPWSFILPGEYERAYGEELLPRLTELFYPTGDYKKTRVRFWKLITDLFSKNFMKQIYDWCEARGLKLTGHLVLEESLESQLASNGACMPHYEYFHIPGMDWLGRNIEECLTHYQVSSVAHQLGKKQVLSETYALCGHNVGHDELKTILEWQMVRGITLLCPHLQGYSLRGIRKRDYPPAMYFQQPWWEEYKRFVDAMSLEGYLLTEGKAAFDTLLIHPQTSAWVCYDDGENKGLSELNREFLDCIASLEKKHVPFDLGDETIMDRHARVEGNTLVIGRQTYKAVILPPHSVLLESTEKLLNEFWGNGGIVTSVGEISKNGILDNENITYTKRSFDGYTLHFFVNSTAVRQKARCAGGSKRLDIVSGELLPFSGEYTFAPGESLMVIDDGAPAVISSPPLDKRPLSLDGPWEIKSSSPNALTLDYCDYYFDGELIEKNGYILNIQGRACDLGRPVTIRCEYTVTVRVVPREITLVCETPQIFDFRINGKELDKTDRGFFRDSAFRKLDVSGLLQEGENKIVLEALFRQSPKVYADIEKGKIFETEKNKLTYDMEIEPIYLVGDFSVGTDGSFEPLPRRCERYEGGFVIDKPAKEVTLSNIERQGFPFFAGSITLAKKISVTDENTIAFRKKGFNSIGVRINGNSAGTLLWEPFEISGEGMLVQGDNEIELTLTNNLRNLLGPHHLAEGETYSAGPHSFYKEPCVWSYGEPPVWSGGYCFAEMSIE